MVRDNSERESIWGVSKEDLGLYSFLFPIYWLVGTAYYAVFMAQWDEGWITVIGQLIMSGGLIGASAAVLAMMTIAGRRAVMPLFDWPTKDKTRAEGRAEGRIEGRVEGRAEGRAEERAEWEVWVYKKSLAEARGEPFDEPSPAERDRAMRDRDNGRDR